MRVDVIKPKGPTLQRFEDFEVGDVLIAQATGNTGVKVNEHAILFLTTDDGRTAGHGPVCDPVSSGKLYIKPQSAILRVEV